MIIRRWRHGVDKYRSQAYACRCDHCRYGNTERMRGERRTRFERLAADPTLAVHGLAATYSNWGCRCRECTDANTAKTNEYRQQRRGVAS